MPTTLAKRSPIKQKALHVPGHSLREGALQDAYDRALQWFLLGLLPVLFAFLEWGRWYFQHPPRPIDFTILALIACAVSFWKVWRAIQEIRRVRLGLEGERAIGQLLQDELAPLGYRIYHDVVNDRGNIDHVAIGPSGVFAIETKTISKPHGKSDVVYDGETVTVAGLEPDRDPVGQAAACAKCLALILAANSIGPPVQPVVLYPGWYVKNKQKATPVWVLNEEYFIKKVRDLAPVLSEDMIGTLANRLEHYARLRDTT